MSQLTGSIPSSLLRNPAQTVSGFAWILATLITAVKREHHHTPSLEGVTSKLAGAKFFSFLDASSGYRQVKLDEPSSKLCTFNSPFGRYRFTRLPFGINCAQDIFQRKVDETYAGLDGVTGIADDITVFGKND